MRIENIKIEGAALARATFSLDGVACEARIETGEAVVREVRDYRKIVLRGDAVPQEVRDAIAEARRVALKNSSIPNEAGEAPPEMQSGPHFLGRE